MLHQQPLRLVAVYKYKWVQEKWTKAEYLYNGYFHSFAMTMTKDETYPVAIVEKEDGSVVELGTEQIVFLDKPNVKLTK
jgi:hypothetical protein